MSFVDYIKNDLCIVNWTLCNLCAVIKELIPIILSMSFRYCFNIFKFTDGNDSFNVFSPFKPF